jgi:hypothetical protein
LRRFVVQAWLADQRDWHARNARHKERSQRRLRWTVVGILVTTLVTAALHFSGAGHAEGGGGLATPGQWFTFLAIALPAWGAALHGVAKQLEYERIAARSEQMARVLHHYVERAEMAPSIEALRETVREAARVVCLENYEWWVLLSFDPPEVVA